MAAAPIHQGALAAAAEPVDAEPRNEPRGSSEIEVLKVVAAARTKLSLRLPALRRSGGVGNRAANAEIGTGDGSAFRLQQVLQRTSSPRCAAMYAGPARMSTKMVSSAGIVSSSCSRSPRFRVLPQVEEFEQGGEQAASLSPLVAGRYAWFIEHVSNAVRPAPIWVAKRIALGLATRRGVIAGIEAEVVRAPHPAELQPACGSRAKHQESPIWIWRA